MSCSTSANLCVMVHHKLWYFDLVRIDRIKEILHSSQIVDSLLYLFTYECQEPPGLLLGREGGREGGREAGREEGKEAGREGGVDMRLAVHSMLIVPGIP